VSRFAYGFRLRTNNDKKTRKLTSVSNADNHQLENIIIGNIISLNARTKRQLLAPDQNTLHTINVEFIHSNIIKKFFLLNMFNSLIFGYDFFLKCFYSHNRISTTQYVHTSSEDKLFEI